ncbi:MAG TPA: acyl carrier protein [Thermoguttaceae bacterium]|nr:acyl carrier protein [Thermoguttaceae bacterium]
MQKESDPATQGGLARDDVFRRVARIVAEQSDTPAERITERDHLINDLGCDSLDAIEIAMEVEEEFDVSIPDDSSEQFQTVGQIVDGVLALLAQSHGE